MKANRKAQIQSGETVVVVIIVIILIILGLVFATRNKQGTIKQETDEMNAQKAMQVAMIASNFNELKCSDYSVLAKSCLDKYRVEAFSRVVKDSTQDSFEYYYKLLGNSKVIVRIITSPGMENYTLFDYNNSANMSSTPVFIPTIVQDKIEKKSYFAIIEVRTYS